MGRVRSRPLSSDARLRAVLCLLPPESLPLGQTLSAAALISSVTNGGVGTVRAGGALSELFSMGLVDRSASGRGSSGDRYAPTAAGARALAMELLRRSDKEGCANFDVPHRGASLLDHRRYIARLLDAADELAILENESHERRADVS